MVTGKIKQAACPHCEYKMDNFAGRGGARPAPGQFCICAHCGTINAFTDDMGLRKVAMGEIDDLAKVNPQMAGALCKASIIVRMIAERVLEPQLRRPH